MHPIHDHELARLPSCPTTCVPMGRLVARRILALFKLGSVNIGVLNINRAWAFTFFLSVSCSPVSRPHQGGDPCGIVKLEITG